MAISTFVDKNKAGITLGDAGCCNVCKVLVKILLGTAARLRSTTMKAKKEHAENIKMCAVKTLFLRRRKSIHCICWRKGKRQKYIRNNRIYCLAIIIEKKYIYTYMLLNMFTNFSIHDLC